MFSLKALWERFTGGGSGPAADEAPGAAVEYNGFRIRPAPFPAEGQFQTAGVIEKDFESGTRQQRFVRAEKHAAKSDAAEFAILKGKQIIDEQGDRLFRAE